METFGEGRLRQVGRNQFSRAINRCGAKGCDSNVVYITAHSEGHRAAAERPAFRGTNTINATPPTTAKTAPYTKTASCPTRSHNRPATTLATNSSTPTVVLYHPIPLARK